MVIWIAEERLEHVLFAAQAPAQTISIANRSFSNWYRSLTTAVRRRRTGAAANRQMWPWTQL